MSAGGSAGQRVLKRFARLATGRAYDTSICWLIRPGPRGAKSCVLPVSPFELQGGEKEKHALFPPFGLATVCTISNCAFFPRIGRSLSYLVGVLKRAWD